ncbi:hypothetical protein [Aquabacterium humicola]|uniref:hypothetical protein n=1 Tax=Aquabacterium humicola TaxID=3237377 RepID=UPI0025432582|nr:hypothetical protein [Rubrivivax pictus]
MDEKDLERRQCLGVIGSLLIAAVVVALAVSGAPGVAQPAAPAAAAVPTTASGR